MSGAKLVAVSVGGIACVVFVLLLLELAVFLVLELVVRRKRKK